MGSRRFELLTSAMSRRRHNQLDHEPAWNNEMPLNMGHMTLKLFSFSQITDCKPEILLVNRIISVFAGKYIPVK